MVTECQQVVCVRLLNLAELDRPLEIVLQNSRPQVLEVTSCAPRQQDSPRLSQPLIHLLSRLRQVSEVAHDTHLVTSAVHSINCLSSSPLFATESIPCQ